MSGAHGGLQSYPRRLDRTAGGRANLAVSPPAPLERDGPQDWFSTRGRRIVAIPPSFAIRRALPVRNLRILDRVSVAKVSSLSNGMVEKIGKLPISVPVNVLNCKSVRNRWHFAVAKITRFHRGIPGPHDSMKCSFHRDKFVGGRLRKAKVTATHKFTRDFLPFRFQEIIAFKRHSFARNVLLGSIKECYRITWQV
ncbi:MAG: hypothetical protein K1X75_16245 [Leptospirales bacterium]|nr:hypothetical protein [Leptospirales bacterium]